MPKEKFQIPNYKLSQILGVNLTAFVLKFNKKDLQIVKIFGLEKLCVNHKQNNIQILYI